MRRLQPLRLLLGIVGTVTLALAAASVYLWLRGDESGSLALATAVATFALAFGAILSIDQNRALVQAASDEAHASSDEAQASRETLEEMQRQRELAYRPWVVVNRHWVRSEGLGVSGWWAFEVLNIGAGPAVEVVLSAIRKDPDRMPVRSWMAAERQGIEPGGSWDVPARFIAPGEEESDEPRTDRFRCVIDDLEAAISAGEIVAVRYQDLFGTHYRSSPDDRRALRPEEWKGAASAIDAPDWLRCQG
jgi:hypothetical protein